MANAAMEHSLKDSIESILSISRENIESVFSHLQEYGRNYLQNAEKYNQGDLDFKSNETSYEELFQNHFNKSTDSPLCNVIGGSTTNLEDIHPKLEVLVQLHWYDFLVEIAISGIQSHNLEDNNEIRWGLYHDQKNWAILEIIHLILLYNSNLELQRKWIDIFQYAESKIIEDWADFLQDNYGILDEDGELLHNMLEHKIGSINNAIYYGKSKTESANLGDYWNQVFDAPTKVSDFQKEIPVDSQIFLKRKRTSWPKSSFYEQLVPSNYLEIAINKSFKSCYICENRYDVAVVKQFVENNDWMYESVSKWRKV